MLADIDLAVLDRVLCAIPEHVFVVDRGGHIVYTNLPLAQAWSIDRADMVGRTFREIALPKSSVDSFEDSLARLYETGRQRRNRHRVAYSALGNRDMDLVLTPVFEADGLSVRFAIGVATDVTSVEPRRDDEEAEVADDGLSKRQREVLTCVAQGYANQEIAAELQISERTVEGHRRQIAARLDLPSRRAYFQYAKAHGYI